MVQRLDQLPADVPIIDVEPFMWRLIRGVDWRVLGYLPLAEVRPGTDLIGRPNVKDRSGRLPYAYLDVECYGGRDHAKDLEGSRRMFPVYHRDDFRAVDQAVALATDEMDMFASHSPIKFPWYVPMKKAQPTMRVMVIRKDAGEKSRALGGQAGAIAFAQSIVYLYEPLVDRFRGRWTYLAWTDPG